MPRSKTRKRDGRPVRMRQPAEVRAAMVAQRSLVSLVEDLDRLLLEVPASYDQHRIDDCVEHHFRCEAVVRFMREHDVPGVLARLAGGELVVMPDPPEVEIIPAASVLPVGDDTTLPTREPFAEVDETGQTVVEALADDLDVWMATTRRGIPYHALVEGEERTECRRATGKGVTMAWPTAQTYDATPCPKCYPSLQASFPGARPRTLRELAGQLAG
jgi:hypothetical protein